MSRTLPAVAVLLVLGSGCATLRRDSLKAMDAEIQKQPRLERERAPGGFRLGAYTIVQRKLRERADDQTPPVTIEGPRRPVWRWELDLALAVAGGPPWAGHCVGTRQSNEDSDYGTIAGVANDSVIIDCALESEGASWQLFAAGRLDGNIGGELRRKDGSGQPIAVEILMWFKRVKLIPRHLAEPVAQVRRGKQVIAAMVLSRPEWAWVQRREGAELRAAAMISLGAIRLLPLGFDE